MKTTAICNGQCIWDDWILSIEDPDCPVHGLDAQAVAQEMGWLKASWMKECSKTRPKAPRGAPVDHFPKGFPVVDYHFFTTINTPTQERRRLGVGDVWINAAECVKCGDVVRSKNRHDFKSCSCGAVAVGGGSWYCRRSGELSNMIDRSVSFNQVVADD